MCVAKNSAFRLDLYLDNFWWVAIFTDDQSERDADIMRGEVSLQRYVKKVSHSLISFIQLPHNLQVSSFALKSFFGWLICAPS